MIPTPIAELTKPLYLCAHTLGRMQPRQIAGMGTRTATELVLPRLPIDFDHLYERRVPHDPAARPTPIAENTALLRSCLAETTRDQYRNRAREAAAGTPTFLNRTLRVAAGTDIDWYDDRFDELPLLWSLKLYAFQPLSRVCLGFDPGTDGTLDLRSTFDGWIRDWIDSVEIGRPRFLRRAWTPWAVSLRILYWSRYFGWRDSASSPADNGDFERTFRRELYKNALFLYNHVERDVGGNHLIENGAALAVAGLLFGRGTWIDAGESILTDAAAHQFLDDGYHFERSPMYHVLALTRYLTVCDLLERSSRPVPEELRTTAHRATTFLRFLQPPDDRIPLLNDAVYGQALALRDCLGYAAALGFGDANDRPIAPVSGGSSERLSDYRWLRTADGAMLVDGGRVGPPHLPGHSHSDTLSVLLWLDGHPVATDTGTFGYVSGSRREYARGVRGHNTVQVDETEPIALGGKYLMGPRPEPTTRFEAGEISLFEGCYEAAPLVGPEYVHHRAVYAGARWWIVWDAVHGHEDSSVCSRLHLHPEVDPSLESSGRVRLAFDDGTAFVYPIGGARVGVTTGEYFPRFGVATGRSVLELHADDTVTDPATLGFLVTRQDVADPVVETSPDGVAPTNLRVAGDEYRLPEVQLSTGVLS